MTRRKKVLVYVTILTVLIVVTVVLAYDIHIKMLREAEEKAINDYLDGLLEDMETYVENYVKWRKNYFEGYGYKTLVIINNELNQEEKLLKKVESFLERNN